MSNFQPNITQYTKNWEDIKLNGEKRQLTDASTKMIEMSELSDKNLKTTIVKCFKEQLQTC